MKTLWGRGRPEVDEVIARLTVGTDPDLDLELVACDALASAAHVQMLASIGILTEVELQTLLTELWAIATDASDGSFRIEPDEEDAHTAIENRLTAELGEAGRKIHTGRSRNDQVLAALRLWGREAVLELAERLLAVAQTLSRLAAEHFETSYPGSTHTRQAMPSTIGHFFAAACESLLEEFPWLETAFNHLNRSPLGSASGYGVALALDRDHVAELLGFASVQNNTLAVQNDRGRTEALVLAVSSSVTTDLGRLATDLIRYSAEEVEFVELDLATTTGSSIMPQKRNPDVLEIIRASAARCRALQIEVAGIYGGVGFSYHRDLQLTKEPFIRGLRLAADCCAAMQRVLDGLTVNEARCREAVLPATAATDAVYERVSAGQPFRDAYRQVAENPQQAFKGQPSESWRRRKHAGAPGDFDTSFRDGQIVAAQQWLTSARAVTTAAWNRFSDDQ